MVVRGYPEEAIRRKEVVEPVIEPVVEPKAVVKYVYVPSERIQLNPNLALITFGIIAAVAIVALAVIRTKK